MTLARVTRWSVGKAIWLALFLWALGRAAPALRELSPLRVAAGMATCVELRQIEAALDRHRALNGQWPEDFERFLRQRFRSRLKNVGTDSWGTPYAFDRSERGYAIRSAGPDRTFGTSDDFSLVHQAGRAPHSGIRPPGFFIASQAGEAAANRLTAKRQPSRPDTRRA